ncbi:MAG: FeoA family protein [Pyrodictiaceae archaeon]
MVPVITLDQLAPGVKATIVQIEGGPGLVRRLNLLGFTPGAIVEVVAAHRGPILVKIRGSIVALGRGVARRIFVKV